MTTTPEPGQRAPDDIEGLAKRLEHWRKRWGAWSDTRGMAAADMEEAAAALRRLEGERSFADIARWEAVVHAQRYLDRATAAEANYNRVWNERDAERRRAEAAEAERDKLKAAFRVNMLRAYPNLSHAVIDAEMAAALDGVQP